VSVINSLKRDFKKDYTDPYEEVELKVPKDIIKAYDDRYKEIAKQALGR